MLKKKPTKKPEEHDFTALDQAVSELSKQTEALLGKTGEKASKPMLPKKRSIPHTKGKSFDIIHDPKHKTALKASLKTAVVSHHKSESLVEETVPLLPDHATKSFNESESTEKVATSSTENTNPAPTIQGHSQGLAIHGQEESMTAEATLEEPADDATHEPSVSHSAITFTEDKTTELESEPPQTAPEESEATPELSAEPETVDTKEVAPESEAEPKDTAIPKSDSKASEEPVEPPAYNSGELFANNLVKESKPHGYKPDENQQKPTVFDTNEYHPELHDWSKLEHGSGLRWLILLLLLVIAGALGYFVVSGQTVPF